MREVTIYALCDPRTGKVRYVGKSVNPDRRLRDHIRQRDKTKKSRWIDSLVRKKLEPKMEVLEKCGENNWQDREKHWIKHMKKEGADLLNQAPGGVWIPYRKRRKKNGKPRKRKTTKRKR